LNLDASPDFKQEDHSDDEDVKMSEDEEEKPSPPTPSANECHGDKLKRKREEDDDEDVKMNNELSKSPAKRVKSESPPPPPPPPAPPVDTPPMQSEEASPDDGPKHLHADTSFAGKSMADVLAEAQQDTGDADDDADTSMQDANATFSRHIEDSKEASPDRDGNNIKNEPQSPAHMHNGHSPRLKAQPSVVKTES
jgi:hypothetical protein